MQFVSCLGIAHYPVVHVLLELYWKALIGAYSIICALLAASTSIAHGNNTRRMLVKLSLKLTHLNNLELKDVELSLENIT